MTRNADVTLWLNQQASFIRQLAEQRPDLAECVGDRPAAPADESGIRGGGNKHQIPINVTVIDLQRDIDEWARRTAAEVERVLGTQYDAIEAQWFFTDHTEGRLWFIAWHLRELDRAAPTFVDEIVAKLGRLSTRMARILIERPATRTAPKAIAAECPACGFHRMIADPSTWTSTCPACRNTKPIATRRG